LGLSELLSEYSEIYILTPSTDIITQTKHQNIQENKWMLFKKNIHLYYHQGKLKKNLLIEIVKQIQPNSIYFNNIWSLSYTWIPVRILSSIYPKIKLILATRGMLDPNSIRIKSFKKNTFLKMLNASGLKNKVIYHSTNSSETNNIKKRLKNIKVVEIPNVNFIERSNKKSNKKRGELKILFLSRIVPIKKLDFALDILTNVPSHLKIHFDIFGNIEDENYFNECNNIILRMPPHVKVNYKGIISMDKTANVIADYHLLFLPSANENFGHAIVESLMCGVPVLISDQTPWIGLESFKAGYDISLNKKDLFLSALIKFAEMDLTAWLEWSRGARDFIQKKMNKEKIKKEYLHLFFNE
jgi:glycosyltransferase involved in cell wall biosynthesis